MAAKKRTFGTFQGVFTPTTLTILGVILFLRHPWVVGNAGVIGALLVVLLSVAITLFTGLSMSSMTTNIRIEAGGPFSIISQSLGLEIGGAIGIPLYLSQACIVAMYIFGFREGWLWIFTGHPAILVDFVTFTVIALIGLISTNFAFQIQYVIMVIILGAIFSIVAGLFNVEVNWNDIQWFGDYQAFTPDEGEVVGYLPSHFWSVFAVFFPAVTGVTVGANMSGELSNPRRAIPVGTLAAVLLTTIIYIAMTFVASFLGSTDELVNNYTIFIDRAFFEPIVIAGLLGATFSSALASFVGAPRILLALAEKNILPKSNFFARLSKKGEPFNAMIFSGIIIILSLLFRELNAIASLITMFFLITYAMINLVVLLEQSLGLPSFRPTIKIPLIIPILGTIGCVLVMFVLNPIVSLISLAIVFAFYAVLVRKELTSKKSDARSGLFTSIAQWATKRTNELSSKREARAWQPELLVPVESTKEVRGIYRLVYAIIHPKGSIKILGMETEQHSQRLHNALPELAQTFKKASLSVSYTFIDGKNFGALVGTSMEALDLAFFKPNTIFLTIYRDKDLQEKYLPIIEASRNREWGLLLFAPFEQVGLGIEKTINLWIDQIPRNWENMLDLGNNDLSLLIALIIRKNWNAQLNIIKTLRPEEEEDREKWRKKLKRIKEIARVPKSVKIILLDRNPDMWSSAPLADLNILEIPQKEELDIEQLMEIPQRLRASCLFSSDSGNESALV